MKTSSLVFVCAALLAGACKDDKPAAPTKGGQKTVDRDEINPYIVKHAREDVVEVRQKIAAKTATLYDCVVLEQLDEIQAADAKLGADLKQVCAYELPVSLIERALEVAEPARKAKPDAITIDGCNVDAGMSIENLEKYGTLDDRARGLIKRLDAACPMLAEVRADRAKRGSAH